ncbi:hypothetical protein [Paenirhodobacter populi]|uniref:Uncharacterized protein n=1 Tax=Paenirhodobacter populi TaxID=2306993 RepID=A0A443J8V4_9RHOB|nr:hypothetical protein [Sinirhodobacter populi]RWR16946.1 hypothetical protein D2T30_20365 [Sinirhodobacter populi]
MIQAIRLGGTERMMVFAFSDPGLPGPARAARERILLGMGVRGAAGAVTRRSLTFAPVLTWDSNINGGYGNSGFTFAGLPFSIDDRYYAVGGVLIGGSLSGALRMALGGQTGLAFAANASAAWAPEHDMGKLSSGVSACVNHMVSYATWGYGCLDASWRRIDLGETGRYGARAGVNHAFFSGVGIHEVTVEVQHNRHDAGRVYDQNVGSVSLTSALSGGYAFAVGIHIAEKIDRVNVMRERIWIGAGFGLLEHPASIMIGTQRNRGGSFLGEGLDKRIWSVGLSYQVSETISVSAYGAKTYSNVAFYDDSQFGLSFDWRFRVR